MANNYTQSYLKSIASQANAILAKLKSRDKKAFAEGEAFGKTLEKTWRDVNHGIEWEAQHIIDRFHEAKTWYDPSNYYDNTFESTYTFFEEKMGLIYRYLLEKIPGSGY